MWKMGLLLSREGTLLRILTEGARSCSWFHDYPAWEAIPNEVTGAKAQSGLAPRGLSVHSCTVMQCGQTEAVPLPSSARRLSTGLLPHA